MHVINKEGQKLDVIYESHDRFLEDIDSYIEENYSYQSFYSLLDLVSAHLLHWYFEYLKKDTEATLIYDKIFPSNEWINRLIKGGEALPEIIIYKFNGISVYDELKEENVIKKGNYESVEINIDNTGILYLSIEDFKNIGGEIYDPEDEDDDFYIELSCHGKIFFFMTEQDEIVMNTYLERCVGELNKIYSDRGLKLINI
jgi:hypothetical protein